MSLTIDHVMLFVLIGVVLVLLLWGRIRYDLVAFSALVIAVSLGIVPSANAFSGFGHPATVIVALVLIVSRGLFNSGAVELVARYVIKGTNAITSHVALIGAIGAALSALMNNVAALALLMPVDAEAAKHGKRSPSVTLMPLSFATILGGMITLIGTPPNIIIATFRDKTLGEPFQMFDFALVGAVVAIAGIIFVSLIGWRLLPKESTKRDARQELQDLAGYISEAKIPEEASVIGTPLRDLFSAAEEHDVALLGLVRHGRRLPGSARRESIRAGDFVVIQGTVESTEAFVGAAGFEFSEASASEGLLGEHQALAEVVVPEGARIEGRSAMNLRLAYRQGVILLGVSRRGRPFRDRVRKVNIQAGDILLLSGPEDRLPEVIGWLGCLPLADRGLRILQRNKSSAAIGFFAMAIIAASTGLLDLPVALGAAAVFYVVFGLIRPTELYESIEWPVIVLLGSMIPIGIALDESGGTQLIAREIIQLTSELPVPLVVLVLMVVTMTLSDVLNNVATALIAAPIAMEIAYGLDANPDTFLMAVAVAASCAFLTPIGHKNNTIIMGPGGYRFSDYWRMGLPLELVVIAVGLPMILLVWPL